MRNYNFDDIKVGNSVFFESPGQNNYDLYWKVIKKSPPSTIIVEIKEMGNDEVYSIRASEIRNVLPL